MLLAIFLVLLSVLLYRMHYYLFHDAHHIYIYFWGDVAFIPIEVLLVTVVIHQLLEGREKRHKLNKMNMLIGAFFSDVGRSLLESFSGFDPGIGELRANLRVDNKWTDQKFDEISKFLKNHTYRADSSKGDLKSLHDLLEEKKQFLLSLLANPNLLEHESFTELLWAVFHLAEELTQREDVASLPRADMEHLSGDIRRAYSTLTLQWLSYMRHLKKDYPYLFSLAVRTNPFYPESSAVIEE